MTGDRRLVVRELGAEALGTAFLLATVVGSGIMAERLAGGNAALTLLGNTLPTGAILFVLIVVFGPISGAHFNPAVTLSVVLTRKISGGRAISYVAAQVAGAVIGVYAAHIMFDAGIVQWGIKARHGWGQWTSEAIAAFGLVLVVHLGARRSLETVAAAVGLYITAAYWFTASTSFANPAVTLARGLTTSFSGIAPADVPAFILAQLCGALLAIGVVRLISTAPEHA